MKIGSVALVVHGGKPQAEQLNRDIGGWLEERGIAIEEKSPDLVVSLGGDGTMLRAARVALDADVPLLGINVGTLGYLTEVNAGDEKRALERVLADDFALEERLMLDCRVRGTGLDSRFVALNEALVERSSRHLIRLGVTIDGEFLTMFNGDGVMVATPTGSTAYALSAGGPIVSPGARCLVVVPVNPHMIRTRPFVLTPDQKVEMMVDAGDDRDAVLSLDGTEGVKLPPGATVTVAGHPRPLRLVKLTGPGFIERLRIKLDLPD